MKNPKHIMNAINLLQQAKVNTRLPWWLKPLDYFAAITIFCGWWGGVLFLLYKLFQWL